MTRTLRSIVFVLLLFALAGAKAFTDQEKSADEYTVDETRFVIHKTNPADGNLRLYWKDADGEIYGSLGKLKTILAEKNQTLKFAMNGGMFNKDQSPQGLYIEEGSTLGALDEKKIAYGNFYLQPNGVFYINKDGSAGVVQTDDFQNSATIRYATQSGPMLLISDTYHPKLKKGSSNLHIRNAVGVLPNGHLMFAMSKEEVNFYDLATLFKQNGCANALYLDGFVSRTYLPSADCLQLDGTFGVIIGEVCTSAGR